jgi:type IV pilus assembly protein PilY1
MRQRIRFSLAIVSLALVGHFLCPGLARASDDTALFSVAVAPNVLIFIDNSGSMNEVVWHPAYQHDGNPTCNYWQDAATYYVNSSSSDTTATWNDTDGFRNGNYTISSSGCVTAARNIFIDSAVQAAGNSTRWDGKYLNWYYSAESAPYISEITSTNNGAYSSCLGGGTYSLYRRSRVTAAKNILKEVICEVNAAGKVRFGIAQFRLPASQTDGNGTDTNGGYVLVPVNDYNDAAGNPNVYTLNGITQSHGDHLDDAIETLEGESWTPLAEMMFQVYTYFMSRSAADRPYGANGTTKFPQYTYRPRETGVGGEHSTAGAPTVPDSPVQYRCQKNFILVVTDGEPTKDDFDVSLPTTTAQSFAQFNSLIGNYNNDGENETVIPSSCQCDSWDAEGTLYLDDIAKFMHDTDFRPDLEGDQTFDVYTVGFSTNAFANALLSKTAAVANGQFHFSNSAEELAGAIVEAVSDIVQKSQAFTAATVPAARTASGGKFYTSMFVPSDKTAYWEGHLQSWTISGIGEILDRNGNCALDDPVAGQCLSGPFLFSAEPFWDAGEVLDSRSQGSRDLYTSKLTGTPGLADREELAHTSDGGVLTAADLEVTFPPATPYPGSTATDAEELAAEVIANVRGCESGTGAHGVACTERIWKLGDIFHSNPVVVPGPSSWVYSPSYLAFRDAYATRRRVIVAGANDGFFRIWDAGTWNSSLTPPDHDAGTGTEIAGFMPYAARKNAKELAVDTGSRDFYFVDGSPSVADVWFYTSPTVAAKLGDGSEWRTVVMGGLRQGGNSYYALDISDPSSAGYPAYLWEFPREDAASAITDYMGQTWSDPILTKVRVSVDGDDNDGEGFERWVAIFAAGYDPAGDPNAHSSYDVESLAGRALVMLDVKTGEILGMKKFDPAGTTSLTDPSVYSYDPAQPEQSMHYAIASTPAVYDLDFDGFADVVYAGDLGGNVWKWVIESIGIDPVNGSTTDTSQPNWPLRKWFSAPIYDSGTNKYFKSFFFAPSATFKSGTLWLAFGSGERTNLQFEGFTGTSDENNRFYAIQDLDPLEKLATPQPVQGESTLMNLTGDGSCAELSAYSGFYMMGDDGEKFVTQSDIFFYYLFVGSFVPETPLDPCDAGGKSYLYAFKVYCGEGLFTDASGDPEPRVDLGEGLPTDPRITICPDPRGNRVIVNKQEGDLENFEAPPGFGSGVGQFYWRELSQ